MGRDTHALSEPAFGTALEVLAANGVDVMIDAADGYTPTPAVSHAILVHNRGRTSGLADGIVVTPSHNPPEDGGFKYNPPHGGPADTEVTRQIEDRANELLASGLSTFHGSAFRRLAALPRRTPTTTSARMWAIWARSWTWKRSETRGSRSASILSAERGVALLAPDRRTLRDDAGSGEHRGGSDVSLHDAGLGRQDPHGLLVALRHGASDRAQGPLRHRVRQRYRQRPARHRDAPGADEPQPLPGRSHLLSLHPPPRLASPTPPSARRSSAAASSTAWQRRSDAGLLEVPVGFKWFVPGLLDGSLGFGGEESAGASLLRRDGTVWTTDKDGIVMDLLAVELTARVRPRPRRNLRGADPRARRAGL